MDISKGQSLARAADKDFVDDEKLMPSTTPATPPIKYGSTR
jgi:hypothetical protein